MAYPGFQRGGCLRSGPIRKAEGGGGGGGGGVLSVSGPIRRGVVSQARRTETYHTMTWTGD